MAESTLLQYLNTALKESELAEALAAAFETEGTPCIIALARNDLCPECCEPRPHTQTNEVVFAESSMVLNSRCYVR
jgi:hypothetical protein